MCNKLNSALLFGICFVFLQKKLKNSLIDLFFVLNYPIKKLTTNEAIKNGNSANKSVYNRH